MQVKQFSYAHDNLGYFVFSKRQGIAIDMGAQEELGEFVEQRGLEVLHVTNTHLHGDHTGGNQGVLETLGGTFLDCRHFTQGQSIQLDDEVLGILLTPGHTAESVCFSGPGFLITGDTLFNGTVGNCFSGDLDAFFHSLKLLLDYPGETLVYSGHDYVKESLNFAQSLESDNPNIQRYLEKYDPGHIVSTLADELKVNPYLRFDDPSMIQRLKENGADVSSSLDRFKALMTIY
ncbi:MAG: MBL fold metallo-hydrolase [Desulfovibrionales bacterium]|nr:MBL fold metallo-hydrolase [Desulfovibrionales bacterium]